MATLTDILPSWYCFPHIIDVEMKAQRLRNFTQFTELVNSETGCKSRLPLIPKVMLFPKLPPSFQVI